MSEEPVQRDFGDGAIYNEILITTPESVDLSRLNTGAPLLFQHDHMRLIGTIVNARIDEDRVGRATVRFSSVGEGLTRFAQVKEGVLTKVSVGYRILEYRIDGDDLLVTRTLPTEISFVSVPADNNVGVGRSLNSNVELTEESHKMDQEDNKEVELEKELDTEVEEVKSEDEVDSEVRADDEVEDESDEDEERAEETDEDVEALQREVEEAERKLKSDVQKRELQKKLNKINAERNALNDAERKAEITAIAEAFNVDATDALNNNISVEKFKEEVSKRSEKSNLNKEVKNMKKNVIEATVRSIKDVAALDDLERSEKGGYLISPSDLNLGRADTTTVTAAGVVETAYDSDFIRPLLAESILGRLPIEVITGVEGRTFTIPKLTSIDSLASFKFYAEGEAIEESVANFSQITLAPKKFGGAIPVTRSLLLTGPNAARWVQEAMVENLRNSLEVQMFETIDAAATQVETAASGAISDTDIEGAIQKLAEANIRIQDCVAIVSPAVYAKLRLTPFLSNVAGVAMAQGMREVGQQYLLEEIPLMVSNFAPEDGILMGNFRFFAIANWTGAYIDVDTTTHRARDVIVYRSTHYLDTVVKHPEAFVKLTIKA
ncbi:phage major capsid protein [Escherichia coli]|nr:phage major capsid protein [Escherichia coli]HBD4590955.1 phage major capsid protein [Shigella sonnei]HBD6759220.1 phage major capsid protein [Shigella sonnei]HCM8577944.1 phage major capsid protein [Shigella boydii]